MVIKTDGSARYLKLAIHEDDEKYHKYPARLILYVLLSVGSPPEILEELEDEAVSLRKKVTLECRVDRGDPKGDVHWFHNDREVYKNKRFDISIEEDLITLEIHKTEVKDTGVYRCEVSNKHARVQTQCKLSVQSKLGIVYRKLGFKE